MIIAEVLVARSTCGTRDTRGTRGAFRRLRSLCRLLAGASLMVAFCLDLGLVFDYRVVAAGLDPACQSYPAAPDLAAETYQAVALVDFAGL